MGRLQRLDRAAQKSGRDEDQRVARFDFVQPARQNSSRGERAGNSRSEANERPVHAFPQHAAAGRSQRHPNADLAQRAPATKDICAQGNKPSYV
jgi:hypothetical protein